MSGKVGVNAMLYPLFSFYINIGKVKKVEPKSYLSFV